MNKLFEYEIKGVKLDVEDMIRIHNYYEAACTAEYVMYNYGIDSEEEALKIGYNMFEGSWINMAIPRMKP